MAILVFRLTRTSGVPPYLQVVHQVEHAIRLGVVERGDRLPTVKEVVEALGINPNTVQKAYRDLESHGLVEGRPGVGTFVVGALPGPSPEVLASLRSSLAAWVEKARTAGLGPDDIATVVTTLLREREEVA